MPQSIRRDATADPYAWLEQRDAPEVRDFLDAENQATEAWLASHDDRREALFEEIRGRIRETDLSLPGVWGPWLYYQRTEAGDEYPRYYRCARVAPDCLEIDKPTEQLLLDLNLLAGDDFLQLGDYAISPDHQWLAYSLDRQGDETYTLYLKDLHSSTADIELPLPNADGSLVWAQDSQHLFAISMDDTSRPAHLWRLKPGAEPVHLFHEQDQRFYLQVYRSSSEQWLLMASSSKNTSEVHVLPANQPTSDWRLIEARQSGHEYQVDHGPDGLIIRSNAPGENFALFKADPANPAQDKWEMLAPLDTARTLEDFSVQQAGLLLHYRDQGLITLEVRPSSSATATYQVAMPDAVYSLHVQGGEEYSSDTIRLRYESLNRPGEVRALHIANGEQQVLNRIPVEGPFDPDAYQVTREWASAPDGSRIPISLVSARNPSSSPAPLYLYGYGAYGASMDPWFSHARLSLLDRGWVFAIAHVRGGADLGEGWYQAGTLEHKHNTFTDFIACAEHLIARNLTDSSQLVVAGGSAGGLLIGNVINQRPELFAAAVADVPFVDVFNTMNNPDLPLTIGEYEEWGDMNEPVVAERVRGYAPYEQVSAQNYPALFVTAGYHDMRVQYWEAAKWVAKLRHCKTDSRPLLLRTQMSAGHGGASGRYQAIRELAEEYSFLLAVIPRAN
jgi:oligopeptidase B